MIDFLKQLPHLEAYGNPFYFIYLGLALLPIFVGLFFKKRFAIYECLVVKSEETSLQISGMTTNDTSKYFLRLASHYRPNNSRVLKG